MAEVKTSIALLMNGSNDLFHCKMDLLGVAS